MRAHGELAPVPGWDALDDALADKPRDEPVHMFCTGGVRCVKAGAYVKQKLGFSDVRRLEQGIVASASIILLLSRGYFESTNCRRGPPTAPAPQPPSRLRGTTGVALLRLGSWTDQVARATQTAAAPRMSANP